MLNDEQTEHIIGGLFVFDRVSNAMAVTHKDGSVTKHQVLVYDKAWESVCNLEAQRWDEDRIFAHLVSKGFIEV